MNADASTSKVHNHWSRTQQKLFKKMKKNFSNFSTSREPFEVENGKLNMNLTTQPPFYSSLYKPILSVAQQKQKKCVDLPQAYPVLQANVS